MSEPAPAPKRNPTGQTVGPSVYKVPVGDDRERLVCAECGFIHYENPKIAAAVEPFLKDFTEQARFHAVGAVLAQKNESSVPALVDAFIDEESVRTRNKIADGLAAHGWVIPEDKRAAFSEKLTPGYGLNAAGVVVRR